MKQKHLKPGTIFKYYGGFTWEVDSSGKYASHVKDAHLYGAMALSDFDPRGIKVTGMSPHFDEDGIPKHAG